MMRYPVAVLRRTVGLPLENEDRRRLFQDNFRAVFLAASREDSGRPIIQYLTDLAETGTENGEYIFPLPTINDLQDRLRNPISGAADRDLTPSGAEDAAYMLRLLRGPLLRYTQDPALYATFMILNLVELESVHFDEHEAVFKEIFNYVHDFIFTLPVERLDANMRQNFVYLLDSIFEAAINCQFAEGNTFWAVQHFGYRYGTANYLRIATGTRNAPLFNIILAQMCIDRVSLDDPIPFHDFTGTQWRQETILFTCIESRNLVGVLELLHAGADPGTAPRSAWLNLSQELDWLKNYMYREQIVEHLKTYFCLERVGDVSDSTLAWLRLIHQIAREHAGLDPLAPHDQISLDEGYYADDERSFDQDDSSGDGDDDGDIIK
ncbi:hypothetical protein F5Y04DRAFT_284335 [Hypomontagnella monticulosa]|nr:hypothetical protein F5Y04DRAFT_284335 [Hypomontagnella monticulosa]